MYRLKSLEKDSKGENEKIGETMKEAMRYAVKNSLTERKTKSKRILGLAFSLFLVYSWIMLPNTAVAGEHPTTRIFTDPLMVEATHVGQNFTVHINVSDVIDLYAWQTGITFNPEVLECTGFYEGEFMKRSNETTLFLEHFKDMNNSLGIVYFRGCCILGPKPGINGSGQVAYVNFTSVGVGISDLHLTDVVLLDTKIRDIEFKVVESFTVSVYGANYGVKIENNLKGETNPTNPPLSGVFDTAFSLDDKKIGFDACTIEDWFCQLSIPKALLGCNTASEWTIKVDGTPISYTATENDTHTELYFEHCKGDHTVEMIGTEAIEGSPLGFAPPVLLVAFAALLGFITLTAALTDLKKTRKVLGYETVNSQADSLL